jgi:hypothetical protein
VFQRATSQGNNKLGMNDARHPVAKDCLIAVASLEANRRGSGLTIAALSLS